MVDKMADFKEAIAEYRAAKKGLNGIKNLPSLAGYEGQQRTMMEEHYTTIDNNNDKLKRTYNNAKKAVLNLVNYSIDNENGFILINGIPFEKSYDNNNNAYVKNHFTNEWILLEEGIIELADVLANKKEENITTINAQLLNKYEKKQTNIKLQKEKRKLEEEEEKRKTKFIGNTITPKTEEITKKTEALKKSININALYGLFLKLLKNILLPKKIGSYKKGSIFVGLTNDEYNTNRRIDRLLEYIQRDDAYSASHDFLYLIYNIEEKPSFKALFDVLMKDDVLEFLFQTLRNMEGKRSKLNAPHYKSILKVLKIVIEDSTSLKPDVKKTIIEDIDNLSNFEDLNSKEANLDKSTSNLVRLENKIKKGNFTPLTNHSNVAVQNLSFLPKMNEAFIVNNAAMKNTLINATPGTTLVPKVVPPKPKSWFGFGGRVSKKRTRKQSKQSKQSKRSKRIQTRRR